MMNKIIVRGGKRLSGRVKLHGAKNAVLPIIAASILGSEGESVIHDAPPLDDVHVINKVLESLGIEVEYTNETIRVNASRINTCEASYELVRKMRASFLVMGPLLTRMGQARISLPGGCAIGTRPIDQHLKGFEAMGAEIELGQGYIEARVSGRLKGAKVYLDVASVGATENIMMAATLADGTTLIENAAKEPEIVDLANYLNAMGAKIRGAGTGIIRVDGVDRLKGAVHTVIPDRIEAGTYMIAAAITNSDLYIEGAIGDHLRPVISKMQEMGVQIMEDENGIRVYTDRPLRAVDVKTLPYPGFPTDMQSQMMALLLTADGTSLVTETIFENRFMHVEEMVRMNAQIKVEGRTAVISGGARLKGAKVCATDLRAGAALILTALVAEGETEITGLHHIDRGYVDIAEKLSRLGADIKRVPIEVVETEAVGESIPLFAVQPSMA
ncbi:UDP-N-acetylglucosamine 1-carboxyvinyltransferase [Paenibacillus naphthalenovorans]|uniref:UDP-N-acetylglucosamine 1-carboxyvinyltransferase n=2 Tax=Paenibacillus TaxID=44249 RepID=A0A0U2N0S6_9BACL|nr:UDP-N-acetylglucosamine 1-carboxyvinyltransferase [Paenibacillus naphthalenovorans]GCL73644.1 UDP-N-acetylglucosamine 1-carboxyvinyltransferase [Paenibacillus naphthalenovorans]SDJ10024.1 UDP-N-acetylglucosamine 1-carboxyvinyltransferase [Paenibacillus naphthalenovorans]